MLENKNRKHIEISKVRFPSSVLRVISRDKMRNEYIQDYMERDNIIEKSGQYQTNWNEHAERLSSQRLLWQAQYRSRWQSKKRWKEQLN
jgi:hypothetical protein